MTQELATQEQQNFMSPAVFDQAMRLCETYAKSELIPAHFRNKPADCFIVMEMAYRLGLPAMALFQQTYVVSGKLGMLATFVIGLINSCGKFKGSLQFEMSGEGDAMSCKAWTIERETGNRLEAEFDYSTAKAEGYTSRNPKWNSMRPQLIRYRAATMFGRLYCPERLMGLHTKEELEDIGPQPGPDGAIPVEGTIIDSIMSSELGPEVSKISDSSVVETAPESPKKDSRSKKTASTPDSTTEPIKTDPEPILAVSGPSELTREDLEAAVNSMTPEQREEFKADRDIWRADNPGAFTALHEYLEVLKIWKSKGKV